MSIHEAIKTIDVAKYVEQLAVVQFLVQKQHKKLWLR